MPLFFRPGRLLRELRRRRVFQVAAVYAAAAWIMIQVSATAFPYLSLPAWSVTLIIVLLLTGFPVAVILAWAYDLTPDGVQRTPRLDPAPAAGEASPPAWRFSAMALGLALAFVAGAFLYLDRADRVPHGETAPDDGTIRSIAVLPFVNMSEDMAHEYFSDGLTEELLNLLAQVEGLRVAARTSSFAFKGVTENISDIGRKLNVETVLEGSVRRVGERLRVTSQLINVADGYHLWSRTFDDRDRADIFSIQDEISRAIVAQLLPRFAAAGQGVPVHGTTTDVHAYEEYLKGRYSFWQGPTESNLRTAIRHYEAALERDPGYALAHAGLSDAFMLLAGQHAPPNAVFPQAKAAALRALELDPQLAEGYIALASINWFYDWDWAAAARNYRRSFSVNRLVYTRCICYAWYLAVLGDVDAAVREGERARALDPVAHLPLTTLAQIYHLAGRPDDARRTLHALEAAGSTSALIPRLSAWLEWDEGRRTEAVAVFDRYRHGFDDDAHFAAGAPPIALAELTWMYAQTGRRADAEAVARLLRERTRERYIPPELVGAAYAALGNVAEASRWLDAAATERSNLGMFSAYPIARAYDDLPRYRELLLQIGVTSERGTPAPQATD